VLATDSDNGRLDPLFQRVNGVSLVLRSEVVARKRKMRDDGVFDGRRGLLAVRRKKGIEFSSSVSSADA
jgi:hypothetical protein